jgi:DNA-binding transcriptional LysR family regulator
VAIQTNQIKALEDELKVQLFSRNGRGVSLTTSGEKLFHYAQKLIALRDEAKSVITNTPELKPIRIGGHETVITYFLPKLLAAFLEENPTARFTIQPTAVSKLKNEVLSDNLDVAFVLEKPFYRQGLKIHTYQQESIEIVCSPSHPLAKKSTIASHELAKERLLLTEQGCCYRNQFERVLINSGVLNPQNISEFVSIETIKECVKLNIGIAALSSASVENELRNGELVSLGLEDAKLSSSIHCILDENCDRTESIEKFVTHCLNYRF